MSGVVSVVGAAQTGMDAPASAPAALRLGLSKAHISPAGGGHWNVRVWDGGGLVELQGPGLVGSKRGGGGTRGQVKQFSDASRLRLMRKLARIRSDALPVFITLTYPDAFIREPKRWKRDLDAFVKRVRRFFPGACGFWKLEMKARQSGRNVGQLAPHFHILLWGVPLRWEDRNSGQLHWRFEFQSRDITNGKRLLKREVFNDGEWKRSETWGQGGNGRVEVCSRKAMVKRQGRLVEQETV